jgi:magnesium-transporting ATPase (P-type)
MLATGSLSISGSELSVVAAWVPGAGIIDLGNPGYDPTVPLGPIGARARFGLELLGTSAAFTSTATVVQDADGRRWRPRGQPMEAAIDAFARRVGAVPADLAVPDVLHAFDLHRRRSSAVVAGMVHVVGEPDAVLPLVTDEVRRAEAQSALEAMSARGLVVLVVARRGAERAAATDRAAIERDLEVMGMLGFQDRRSTACGTRSPQPAS